MRKKAAKAPGNYHHGDLEHALIEEAIVLTAEKGVEAWTLAEMARRLGVSSGAPYRHFQNKTDLLDAVARHGLQQVHGVISGALQQRGEPGAQMLLVMRGLVLLAHRQPILYQLTFAGVRHATFSSLSAANETTAFGALRNAVTRWMDAGFLVKGDAITTAVLLWAHLHGLSSLVATRRIQLSERRALKMAEAHGAALLNGIATRSGKAAARKQIAK